MLWAVRSTGLLSQESRWIYIQTIVTPGSLIKEEKQQFSRKLPNDKTKITLALAP